MIPYICPICNKETKITAYKHAIKFECFGDYFIPHCKFLVNEMNLHVFIPLDKYTITYDKNKVGIYSKSRKAITIGKLSDFSDSIIDGSFITKACLKADTRLNFQ